MASDLVLSIVAGLQLEIIAPPSIAPHPSTPEPHFDYFLDPLNAAPSNGGQRLVTALMFLRAPEEGGETVGHKSGPECLLLPHHSLTLLRPHVQRAAQGHCDTFLQSIVR